MLGIALWISEVGCTSMRAKGMKCLHVISLWWNLVNQKVLQSQCSLYAVNCNLQCIALHGAALHCAALQAVMRSNAYCSAKPC